jgi:hypothetical protein
MAKKDLTTTSDNNSVGSRSAKIREHEKSLLALQKAQLIPRKVIKIPMGECQYSRELKNKENIEDLLISRSAAEYLKITYSAFTRRLIKLKVPYVLKRGNHRFFKISDLDKFKDQFQCLNI